MYDLLKYFTFINLCLIVVHIIHPKINVVNLHLTTLVTCFYGLYISYHQNKLYIRLQSIDLEITFVNLWLKVIDFVFHFLPFLYVWSQLEFNGQHIMLTMMVISIYYVLVDVKQIYGFDNEQHFKIILLLICTLFMFRCIISKNVY